MNAEFINKVQELKMKYEWTEDYTIKNPGKFEGETIATLYYYDAFLSGGDTIFDVSRDESEAFDIDSKFVYLHESSDGFVSLEYFDFQEDAEERESWYYGYDENLED